MPRYAMLVDVKKCNGCYNCFLACRDEHYGNDYPGYSAAQPLHGQFWMQLTEIERGQYPKPKLDYVPKPCLQCEQAPCLEAGVDGAVYRRPDGIVVIDPVKAKGQEAIVHSCPHRVIYWNAELELAQKCTFCAHRLDEGEPQPRCVESCPTGALVFGDLDDPGSEVVQLAASQRFKDLHPEFDTRPRVRYSGIPKRFVTGEIVLRDSPGECAQGIEVALSGDGQQRVTTTDLFGDFEFDDLERNQRYHLSIKADGYSEMILEFDTKGDVNLGEINLEPR